MKYYVISGAFVLALCLALVNIGGNIAYGFAAGFLALYILIVALVVLIGKDNAKVRRILLPLTEQQLKDSAAVPDQLAIATPDLYGCFENDIIWAAFFLKLMIIALTGACIEILWLQAGEGVAILAGGLIILFIMSVMSAKRVLHWSQSCKNRECVLNSQAIDCSPALFLYRNPARSAGYYRVWFAQIKSFFVQPGNSKTLPRYDVVLKMPYARWLGIPLKKLCIRRDQFTGKEKEIIDFIHRYATFPIQINDTLK